MTTLVHLTSLDPRYPSRLRGLERAPASLAVRGGPIEAPVVVAIVGSREATPRATWYAGMLADRLASAGAVVCSGGALGIDGAAHRGALAAGGRTWVVAPTGPSGCFPPEHAPLFEEVARGPGAMIWPLARTVAHTASFRARNRVLVALSDAVVVVQAGRRSGALHAAGCARKQRKPLWVVPPAPWAKGFQGSRYLIETGALPLTRSHLLLRSLALSDRKGRTLPALPGGADRPGELSGLSSQEIDVLRATSSMAEHADFISTRAGLSPQATTAALLTLALENVVVEGPPGFFRRGNAHNR